MSASRSNNGFWKGLVGFGAPIAVLSFMSTRARNGTGPGGIDLTLLVFLWFVAAAFLLVALIGAIVFHRRQRPDIGNGALTALALGIVILLGTCVFNLSNPDSPRSVL